MTGNPVVTAEGDSGTGSGRLSSTWCTDSDGGINYYVQGFSNSSNSSGTDLCMDSNNLREYYCAGGMYTAWLQTNCNIFGNYVCQNGACVLNQAANTCTDSDGGLNYNTLGSVYGFNQSSGQNYTFVDVCGEGNYRNHVYERYCTSSNTSSWNLYDCISDGKICQNGVCVTNTTNPICGNGVVESGEQCDGTNLNGQTCVSRGFTGGTLSCSGSCTFNTASCTVTYANGCYDSDGGINPNTFGSLYGYNGSNFTIHDVCSGTVQIREAFCSGVAPNATRITCSNGCSNGACKSPPSYICGDADGSGDINIGDVTKLIYYIFQGGAAPNPIQAGDADGDGVISIADITYLVDYIFKGGSAPICPNPTIAISFASSSSSVIFSSVQRDLLSKGLSSSQVGKITGKKVSFKNKFARIIGDSKDIRLQSGVCPASGRASKITSSSIDCTCDNLGELSGIIRQGSIGGKEKGDSICRQTCEDAFCSVGVRNTRGSRSVVG